MDQTRETPEIGRQPSVKESTQSNQENAARVVRVVLIKDGILLRPGDLAPLRPR